MKLEVNITETVTPEEVAESIFNYKMVVINEMISDETECVIENKDCNFALKEEFKNFNDRKRMKWFAEVLKELIKYYE